MNLFSRKLRLLSLLVSSTILATLATPQATIAAPMAAKLSGIERIVASSGFFKILLRCERMAVYCSGIPQNKRIQRIQSCLPQPRYRD